MSTLSMGTKHFHCTQLFGLLTKKKNEKEQLPVFLLSKHYQPNTGRLVPGCGWTPPSSEPRPSAGAPVDVPDGRVDGDARAAVLGPQHVRREHLVVVHHGLEVRLPSVS